MSEHVQYWSLGDLKPWGNNYRHGDVDAIVASIERFGFNGALRIRDGIVFAGNHALAALEKIKSIGHPMPKGLVSDPDGGWLIPCIDISHLNEVEAEAFAIADNRTQELGTQDSRQLAQLLDQIGKKDVDLLSAASFNQADLDNLIASIDAGSFTPDPSDEHRQGGLDSTKAQHEQIECPECGARFTP